MATTVTTQAELDAALEANAAVVCIESPAVGWLTLQVSGSSRVVAGGSSSVVARGSSRVVARGSSRVEARDSSRVEAGDSSRVVARGSSRVEARDSSRVEAGDSSRVVARDSSRVVARDSSSVVARDSSSVEAGDSSRVEAWDSSRVEAWGSSHVEAWGSSRVVAWGSSRVVAWGSSHVEAWGSSHVEAGAYVAVHLHSQRVTLEGGVVIDMTAVNQSDPATWCDLNGVKVVDGVASLYKALDDNYCAGQAYTKTKYAVGKKVTAKDWRDDGECGGGLHLGPTPNHATAYRTDATRWVRVEVPVTDLRPILGDTAKCKVKSCRVVEEVDRWGLPLGEVAA